MRFLVLIILIFSTITACASKQALLEDEQMLQQLMAVHQSDFQACFDSARSTNPQLAGGQLVIKAEHAPNGIFVDLRQIRGFTGSGPVYDCLAEEIRRWKTERPRTMGTVELSWNFEAGTPRLAARQSQLTKEEVERVFKANAQDFNECFDKTEQAEPGFRGGEVQFEVQVQKSGQLEYLELISGAPGSRKLLECLERKGKSAWVFPERDAPSTIGWSWKFNSTQN